MLCPSKPIKSLIYVEKHIQGKTSKNILINTSGRHSRNCSTLHHKYLDLEILHCILQWALRQPSIPMNINDGVFRRCELRLVKYSASIRSHTHNCICFWQLKVWLQELVASQFFGALTDCWIQIKLDTFLLCVNIQTCLEHTCHDGSKHSEN